VLLASFPLIVFQVFYQYLRTFGEGALGDREADAGAAVDSRDPLVLETRKGQGFLPDGCHSSGGHFAANISATPLCAESG
jgi:hypothetical protein